MQLWKPANQRGSGLEKVRVPFLCLERGNHSNNKRITGDPEPRSYGFPVQGAPVALYFHAVANYGCLAGAVADLPLE